MQLLSDATTISAQDCARQLLDVNLQLIAIIRKHMRAHRSGLSVPQFRTLCYVGTADGCSLSAAADFVGLSLPAMSRLVDALVNDNLIARRPGRDRRQIRLSITPQGEATVRQARQLAQAHMADSLAKLSVKQRTALADSLKLLATVFAPEAASTDLAGKSSASQND